MSDWYDPSKRWCNPYNYRWYNPYNYPLAAGDKIKANGKEHVVAYIGSDMNVVTSSEGKTFMFTPFEFKSTFKGISYG